MPVVMRQNLITFGVAGRKIEAEVEAEAEAVVVAGAEVKVAGIGREALGQTIGVAGTKRRTWDAGSISTLNLYYSIGPAN